MDFISCKYILILIVMLLLANSETIKSSIGNNKAIGCINAKPMEEVFRPPDKSISINENLERTKLLLNSIAKVKTSNDRPKHPNEDAVINGIIASINRIKDKVTKDKERNRTMTDERVIIKVPIKSNQTIETVTNLTKSEIKTDNNNETLVKNNQNVTSANSEMKYVEILTIEPNNTSHSNKSQHDVVDILKHFMPMFNKTQATSMNNMTLVNDGNENSTLGNFKNVSKIDVIICEENLTKANITNENKDAVLEIAMNETIDYDYYVENQSLEKDDVDYGYADLNLHQQVNLTVEEKNDILDAANYGIQKMHELYSIVEPKLYSMGLWLDDRDPARYVAAFNAPAEDVGRFSRYGYASLQAASRLKQLISNNHGSEEWLESRTEEAGFPSASALRQSSLLQHCPLRAIPKCPPASKRYRTHDGTCNNFNRPRWGSTMTPVQRFLTPSYSDGIQAPRKSVFGSALPSARKVSSTVHEDQYIENPDITHLLMQWGQFVDHDIVSSSQSRGFNGSVPRCCKNGGREFVPKELLHPECLPIAVPPSDPFYGPLGVRCLDFVRSSPAPRDDCALGWREQINQVSAYIDGSPLYASSARQSDKLRLFRNGMLQYGRVQQRKPLLPPERTDELCRGGAVSTECFKSGDARVNEHPGLVAAHIVWLRQHNRMAAELASLNPHWSDEKLYQETRKITGAMIQHITYKEFLPIVLGAEVMRLFELEPQHKGYYREYNPKTNPSPASAFGSAAFRFGHSLVQPSMVRFDRFHRPLNNNVSLHDELTNPSNIWSMGAVDRLLLGMVNQPIQKRDEFITEELTNHLFQTTHFKFGMDLAAINIQRGRDHGIPPYTSWRQPCGLTEIKRFDDLLRVMPARAVRKLQDLYRDVEDIDLFTGGMAERPVVGGLVGPTFACVIAQQFSILRKGDRFWYENGGFESSFTPAQLQQIRKITFAQILCRTLDTIETIQPFVFLSHNNKNNQRLSCNHQMLNNFELSPWREIRSDIDNDISKTDNDQAPTERPKKPKPNTTKRPTLTTTKLTTMTKNTEKLTTTKLPTMKNDKLRKPTDTFNKTDNKDFERDSDDLTLSLPFETLIDDKLDFKNKSRQYENSNRQSDKQNSRQYYNRPKPTPEDNEYDNDEENIESVQSVVITNLGHKRPNHKPYYYDRPVLAVTENIDKYTYLINYVPKPTQSWRQTSRQPPKRDVVKVTYQTYDDTYRRPYNPYIYNRQDDKHDITNDKNDANDKFDITYDKNDSAHDGHDTVFEKLDNTQDRHDMLHDKSNDQHDDTYRRIRPNKYNTTENDNVRSSARSNEETVPSTISGFIDKQKDIFTLTMPTTEKTNKKIKTTTENTIFNRLVTFSYLGTYKRDQIDETKTEKSDDKLKTMSKDFSTYDLNTGLTKDNLMKLSTFYRYETATQAYRPNRRHDASDIYTNDTNRYNKYYYVKNVLHKVSTEFDKTMTNRDVTGESILKENYNNPGQPNTEYTDDLEERTSDFFDYSERSADPVKRKPPAIKKPSPAKTPSVTFEIVPSENSPSKWAVYEELEDLSQSLFQMPEITRDPQASSELPKPLHSSMIKKRTEN